MLPRPLQMVSDFFSAMEFVRAEKRQPGFVIIIDHNHGRQPLDIGHAIFVPDAQRAEMFLRGVFVHNPHRAIYIGPCADGGKPTE